MINFYNSECNNSLFGDGPYDVIMSCCGVVVTRSSEFHLGTTGDLEKQFYGGSISLMVYMATTLAILEI